MEGSIVRWIGQKAASPSSSSNSAVVVGSTGGEGKRQSASNIAKWDIYEDGFEIINGRTGNILETIKPHDCVLLKNGGNGLPFVAVVTKTFEDAKSAQKMIECRWFYRKQDTRLHPSQKKALRANELLISDSKGTYV